MKPWQVQTSTMLIEDRWMRLRADSCKTDKGTMIEPYYVLDYSPWVSVFAMTDDDDVILVRQYRHAIESITLELPSGGFERADLDAASAAKRELLEETGYSSARFFEIAKIAPNPASHTNFNHVIFTTGARQVAAQYLDDGEDIEIVLMPVQQVRDELASGTFVAAIQTAAICHGLLHVDALR